MDSKQGPPGPPGPRRPRGYVSRFPPPTSDLFEHLFELLVALTTTKTQSFFNPPPAPLPPGYSNNPFLGPMHNTTGPMTNRSYAPLPIHPSTSAPQTPAHHIPAPIPRPDRKSTSVLSCRFEPPKSHFTPPAPETQPPIPHLQPNNH